MDGFKEIMDGIDDECIVDYVKGFNIAGIVCRCHPKDLQNRLSARDYSASKVAENIQAEILSESTQNLLEVMQKEQVFEIDTSIHPVNDIAQSIINIYHQIAKRRVTKNTLLKKVGEIDWIITLDREGSLNSYFKDDYGESFAIDLRDIDKEDAQGDSKK